MNVTVRSQWSISPGKPLSLDPILTSWSCYTALADLFQDDDESKTPFLLALLTEASSHPTGLESLYAQPYIYAGGGLGNMDECPMQVCVAGGTGRDSLTFASVCIVPECDASDLSASDFVERLQTASFHASSVSQEETIQEYVTLHKRIAQVNQFLGTGWVCGEYKVDWEIVPSSIYLALLCLLFALSIKATFFKASKEKDEDFECNQSRATTLSDFDDTNEEKKDGTNFDFEVESSSRLQSQRSSSPVAQFFSAWDICQNMRLLTVQRSETSFLDGLKFGSILWVIFGHVLAIQSSAGAGYLNPRNFLPPNGITTTVLGQLLFSSRFAVDTFLCVSGYLAVHVLRRKLKPPINCSSVFKILLFRILRILPLYAMCIGFWMFIAPHLGSGPFWYKWESFLQPCFKFWWTNILFVNNFIPWGTPTTDTCFYHSWYLAVDVQLFFLLSPWLVLLYGRSVPAARRTTLFLWSLSVVLTAMLTYSRNWSVNTFDGGAVALFDVEGYAKPHIRAQSYLAGMYVAMLPRGRRRKQSADTAKLALALSALTFLSLITVTGAYTRRACTFEELPSINNCGSTWTPEATFFYTAFSRAIWSACIAFLMYSCQEKRAGAVGAFLSWNIWTPLAHLSFGVYLVHPIVIFVWQLGGREKITFRVFSFFMDFTSISVVGFVLAAVAALIIEFPFGALLRPKPNLEEAEIASLIPSMESTMQLYRYRSYGATGDAEKHFI